MEKLTLEFFITVFVGTLCVGVSIALWVNRAAWLPLAGRIVSIISGDWRASLERARLQKAARERLYGYADMSSSDERAVSGVRPLPGSDVTSIDIVALANNLTEAQYVELGARLQDRRGKFVFSGRNLYKLAGGNHDEFLANMRRWRGEQTEEPAYTTPIVGRPTSARFETDADYPYHPIDA